MKLDKIKKYNPIDSTLCNYLEDPLTRQGNIIHVIKDCESCNNIICADRIYDLFFSLDVGYWLLLYKTKRRKDDIPKIYYGYDSDSEFIYEMIKNNGYNEILHRKYLHIFRLIEKLPSSLCFAHVFSATEKTKEEKVKR